MSNNLFEKQKNSNYDKLYLERDRFEDGYSEIKKEFPKEFFELLKEFENT